MRLLVFFFATCLTPGAVHAEAIDARRGPGTLRLTVSASWAVRARSADDEMGVRLAQRAGPTPSTHGEPFTFTVPQSRVIVKVSDASLRPDDAASAEPNYFKLARPDPQLILSCWLEPASRYKGLKQFWDSESRSPAYAGALAPTRVEMFRDGPWEVVAFDVPAPGGGTHAHLRAERVEAGTWIDLHLSTASARPPATLRVELLAALRRVDVVEK
jgi:hypothetical protein